MSRTCAILILKESCIRTRQTNVSIIKSKSEVTCLTSFIAGTKFTLLRTSSGNKKGFKLILYHYRRLNLKRFHRDINLYKNLDRVSTVVHTYCIQSCQYKLHSQVDNLFLSQRYINKNETCAILVQKESIRRTIQANSSPVKAKIRITCYTLINFNTGLTFWNTTLKLVFLTQKIY